MAPSLWIKLSVDFYTNPKVLEAGNDAVLLWIRGLCHSKQHVRDGFVPAPALPMLAFGLGDTFANLARRLLDVGLWEERPGGYAVPMEKWAIWQQTKDDLERRTDAARKAARSRWHSQANASPNADRNSTGNANCINSAMQETETETETETEKKNPRGAPDLFAGPDSGADEEDSPKKKKISAKELAGRWFDSEFWPLWPNHHRKTDKAKCREKAVAVVAAGPPELAGQILDGLRRWIASQAWADQEGKFIPLPMTWLNGRRWEDDPVPSNGKHSAVRPLIDVDGLDGDAPISSWPNMKRKKTDHDENSGT